MTTHAGEGGAEWCERQWKVESARAAHGDAAERARLLARWQQYRTKCSGTGVFEARLALAHAAVADFDAARKVLGPLLGGSREHQELIELVALQVEYLDLGAREAAATVEDVRRLEEKLRALGARYPRFAEAKAILGSVQSLLGEHAAAIASLEGAMQGDMNLAGVYRDATISYAAVERYADARRAAEEALRRNPRYREDRWFVFALARTHGALGNFKAAQDELTAISDKGDEVVRDPEFKRTLEFVKARWAEYKARNGLK